MNQDSPAPTNKVAAAGAAGALSVLIVFIAGQLGLEIPPEAAAAITTLLSFGAGYMRLEGRSSWGGERGTTLVEALVIIFLLLVILVVLFRLV